MDIGKPIRFIDLIFRVKSFVTMIIVTLGFLTVGIVVLNVSNAPRKDANWIENQATISKLLDERAYVDHVVKGVTYKECELDVFDSSWTIGLKHLIRYNPDDPNQVSSASNNKTTTMIIYTVCFTIAAFIPVAYVGANYMRYKKRLVY